MINRIRYFFMQRKASRCYVVLKGIDLISHQSNIVFEAHAKLRYVNVELPERATPLRIGAYSYVRSGSRLLHVRDIGRYCSIGRGVTLGETPRNHPVDWVSTSLSVSHQYKPELHLTSIGHDVWIGHGAVVMAGVKVGHGAIIARNALVTKDVEPYQIVGGNPAKPIRYRFDEATRAALLASHWWTYDLEQLRQLDFSDCQRFLEDIKALTEEVQYPEVRLQDRHIL